jgi:NADH-quinone oxidoreductase subunit L
MFCAMGGGSSPQAGMFHLTTHAFFKALMFLGAGSVIHALHSNDLWKMGGLAKKMPLTAMTFAAGWVAIIGFPLTSGFFSKEAVLHAVYSHTPALFWILAFTAFLTTFYMTRLMILAFMGDTRDAHRFAHAHESGPAMLFPLLLLAGFSLFAGGLLHYNGHWEHLIPSAHAVLSETASASHGEAARLVLIVSTAAWVLGIALASAIYSLKVIDADALVRKFPAIHRFLTRRYADELYLWLIKTIYHPFAAWSAKVDYEFLDQIVVDGTGRLSQLISRIKAWIDDKIVDGILVNGFGTISQSAGTAVRRLQTGFVQFYLLIVAFGLSVLLLWLWAAKGF